MSRLPKWVNNVELLSCRGYVAADSATEQFVKLFFLLKSLSDEMAISFLLFCVSVGLLKEQVRETAVRNDVVDPALGQAGRPFGPFSSFFLQL